MWVMKVTIIAGKNLHNPLTRGELAFIIPVLVDSSYIVLRKDGKMVTLTIILLTMNEEHRWN